jgi:predicted metal-binding membrane protein
MGGVAEAIPATAPPRAERRYATAVVIGVLAVAFVAWGVTYARMDGMEEGPGTALGALPWDRGVWVTMMAAMLLPAVAPVALLVARANARKLGRRAGVTNTSLFLASYVLVWTGYGLAAYAAYRLIAAVEDGRLAWTSAGPYVAGAAVAAAGLYQLTPLKQVCLRHCRSPLHLLFTGWRDGPAGAVRMGVAHAAYCVGCCAGLMVVLFAVGVMSLLWMTVVAAVIFAEKVVPHGESVARAVALALVALGLWIAIAPGSVPGLTDPGGSMPTGGMEMEAG